MPGRLLDAIRSRRVAIVLIVLLTPIALFAYLGVPEGRRAVVLIVAFALALAAAWLGGRAVALRRLRALAATARRLGAGDLDARTGIAHAADDIGDLARALDAMAEGIAQRETILNEGAQELKRANRALRALSASNRALLEATDERALLQRACRNAVEIGGYRMAWIGYAADDETKTVRPMARAGIDDGYFDSLNVTWSDDAFGQGTVGTAIRTARPVVIQDILADPRCAPWHDAARVLGYASAIALPIRIEGRVIGALAINADERNAFRPTEVELLAEMADDLAFGIQTIRRRAEQRSAENIIRVLAYRDPLTGLPNRARFREIVEKAIEDARTRGKPLALLSLGFANFREITDTLGYRVGIDVLRHVAPRVRPVLGSDDTLALTHGNDFGILLPGVDARDAASAAKAVYALFRQSVTVERVTVDMRMAVGIALFPDHGETADDLMRRADVAMRAAIRRKAPFIVYDPDLDRRAPEVLRLAVELRHAIETGQLLLHVQPKADLRTGAIDGAEVLVRWHDPNRGPVRPDEFIPLAERIGLIRPLTRWVIEAAFRQSHAWQAQGFTLPLAINLSARNLLDADMVDEIDALAAAWRIAPATVGFEITETALMEDPAKAMATVTRLHARGFHLFIDDFGVGYSSLGYLQKLPVDAIKIDKSFVGRMVEDADSATIVRSTIELAHGLGKKVVAEGVETRAMWDRLREIECDAAQGYYLSRPMPIAEIKAWTESRRRGGSTTEIAEYTENREELRERGDKGIRRR